MGEDTDALDRTNKYRAKHGVGPLRLDQTLNNHAQAWADRAGTFHHDPDSPEGENIAMGQANATNAVDDFYNEVQKYNFKNPGFSGETGHFTQLVWKSTERLGIGIGNINGQRFYVFRYAPPGNIVGDNGRYFRENVLPAQPSPPKPQPPTTSYTIKAGDTFLSIAKHLGVAVKDIQRLNPGVNPEQLAVGQIIKVPKPAKSVKYTIKAGDTFKSIAKKLGVSVDAIQRLNPGVKPEKLTVGQIIKVPAGKGKKPTGPSTTGQLPGKHTIKAGDTFLSISQQLGVSVDDIQRLNPGVKPEQLSVGQTISVPGGKGQVPKAPPAGPPTTGQAPGKDDTLLSITLQLGVSEDNIKLLNPGVNPEQLSVGQTINVPGGKGVN